MTFKPVDTAIVMVVGPCIDDTDFKSLEEAIAYDASGMDVSLIVEKTDGTTAVTAITLTTAGTSDWTHKDGGYYEIEVTAAQNAEEGIAYIRGICTGVLPFESPRYNIVKANVYDSLVKGTDVLQTDVTQLAGVAQSLTDLKDLADTGYDPVNHKIQSDLIYIHGSALTETAGQLAAAFTKLFDVATPLLVASDVMRGTDSAALAATALTDVTWTDAKAAFIDASIAAIPTTAMRGTDNAALAATALSDAVWTDAKAAFLDHSIATVDGNVDTLVSRLTAARAGYLDNLSAGAVALASGVDLTKIHGAALTETIDGYLAAAFIKLFDVAAPLLVASDVMRGTDDAALAATALTDATWTDAKAAFLDHSIATVDTVADGIQTDLDNATDGLGALKALIDTVDGNVDDILLDTGTDGVVVASGSKTGYALTSTGANLILKDSTFALAIADAIWDEILTGATHNISTSAGRRVREIAGIAIQTGTAQAATVSTITIDAAANGGDGVYNRNLLVILEGTGKGQTRTIVDYNDTTKVCLVDREWRITPDATSEYQILADDTPLVVDHGLTQAATNTTVTIRDYASAIDETYTNAIINIMAGTGKGQSRIITAYNGTTKVVTVCTDWETNPDATSVYVIMPYGISSVACMSDDSLAAINAECDTALTDYDGPTRTEATTDKNAIITEVDANETKIDTLQTDSTAIKAKTDNLPSGITKNVALSDFQWLMVLTSDHVTAATGKTVVGAISKDGGAFGALTNAITEIGNGLYKVDLTQTEMNADVITLKFTETDCDQRTITVYTV